MKTILIYATKYGSTRKAAELLKEKLNGDTVLVDVARDTVPPLDGFDTVILGGSIYAGQIQKPLTAYSHANAAVLQQKRLGLFLCAASTDTAMQEKNWASAFPSELLHHASAKETLGYQFDFSKMNFFERLIIKKMTGSGENVSKFYEDKIDRFAQAINE